MMEENKQSNKIPWDLLKKVFVAIFYIIFFDFITNIPLCGFIIFIYLARKWDEKKRYYILALVLFEIVFVIVSGLVFSNISRHKADNIVAKLEDYKAVNKTYPEKLDVILSKEEYSYNESIGDLLLGSSSEYKYYYFKEKNKFLLEYLSYSIYFPPTRYFYEQKMWSSSN